MSVIAAWALLFAGAYQDAPMFGPDLRGEDRKFSLIMDVSFTSISPVSGGLQTYDRTITGSKHGLGVSAFAGVAWADFLILYTGFEPTFFRPVSRELLEAASEEPILRASPHGFARIPIGLRVTAARLGSFKLFGGGEFFFAGGLESSSISSADYQYQSQGYYLNISQPRARGGSALAGASWVVTRDGPRGFELGVEGRVDFLDWKGSTVSVGANEDTSDAGVISRAEAHLARIQAILPEDASSIHGAFRLFFMLRM